MSMITNLSCERLIFYLRFSTPVVKFENITHYGNKSRKTLFSGKVRK